MDGGRTRSRDRRRLDGLRRGSLRALTTGLVAILAAVLVAGAREPSRQILADAGLPAPAAPGTAETTSTTPSTLPPVQLPTPTGRTVRSPASSGTALPTGPADVQGIPAVALAAYQRSAAVIDAADSSCRLDWSVLAAIGQVESDQGQVDGSHLDAHGVARPAIIGPRLDGRHGTSRVRDSDAGRLDGDRRLDRAVGPMQFLPSTWAAVAVDGDDDGHRNVQDIDDASLGSAVYLCADHGDLSTAQGQRAALLRYNHSRAYAEQVMSIARQLRASGLLPAEQVSVRTVALAGPLPVLATAGHGHQPTHDAVDHQGQIHSHGDGPSTGTSGPQGPVIKDPVPPSVPTQPTAPTEPTQPAQPTDPTTPPAEAPVLTDPLPAELADLTADQVAAYNTAWAACDNDLTPGWSADQDTMATLTQCLADSIEVATDDPDLTAFVAWLAQTQDSATQDGATQDGATQDAPTQDAPTP